jgi:hypothetical protein
MLIERADRADHHHENEEAAEEEGETTEEQPRQDKPIVEDLEEQRGCVPVCHATESPPVRTGNSRSDALAVSVSERPPFPPNAIVS